MVGNKGQQKIQALYNKSRLAKVTMISVALASQIIGLFLAGFVGLLVGAVIRRMVTWIAIAA